MLLKSRHRSLHQSGFSMIEVLVDAISCPLLHGSWVVAAIAEGMGQPERLSYQVSVSQGMRTGEKDEGFSLISLAPQLTTYTCTMESSLWPLSHGLFGVEVSGLTHRRSYVVDPYRPGIVA